MTNLSPTTPLDPAEYTVYPVLQVTPRKAFLLLEYPALRHLYGLFILGHNNFVNFPLDPKRNTFFLAIQGVLEE
jgi:hypothetical protein